MITDKKWDDLNNDKAWKVVQEEMENFFANGSDIVAYFLQANGIAVEGSCNVIEINIQSPYMDADGKIGVSICPSSFVSSDPEIAIALDSDTKIKIYEDIDLGNVLSLSDKKITITFVNDIN